jgi:hypothetical protein
MLPNLRPFMALKFRCNSHRMLQFRPRASGQAKATAAPATVQRRSTKFLMQPEELPLAIRIWELHQRYPNSFRRNKDFNCCGLLALTAHCEEEEIEVRREIACASAFHGGDSPKFGVVIRPLLPKHRGLLAPARIDSLFDLLS